jgi:hypothetical protein
LEALQECSVTGLRFPVVRSQAHYDTDAPDALRLLRARRERPRRRRAAYQRDELASSCAPRGPFSLLHRACRTQRVRFRLTHPTALRRTSTTFWPQNFSINLHPHCRLPLASSCAACALVGFPLSHPQNSWPSGRAATDLCLRTCLR